jgi:hypothetical protein
LVTCEKEEKANKGSQDSRISKPSLTLHESDKEKQYSTKEILCAKKVEV